LSLFLLYRSFEWIEVCCVHQNTFGGRDLPEPAERAYSMQLTPFPHCEVMRTLRLLWGANSSEEESIQAGCRDRASSGVRGSSEAESFRTVLSVNIILGPPVATRTRPLCFAAVSFFLFFLFLFSARSPRSLSRSPRNFATWSEMGAILKTRSKIWGSFPPKKIGARKHAFFSAISDNFTLRSRISPDGTRYRQSENSVANYDLSRVCWCNLVNFGPQTANNRTVV